MLVVLYGGYTLYNNKNNAIVKGITVICFLLTIYLYNYGQIINNFCFHPEYCVSNNYHILLHLNWSSFNSLYSSVKLTKISDLLSMLYISCSIILEIPCFFKTID